MYNQKRNRKQTGRYGSVYRLINLASEIPEFPIPSTETTAAATEQVQAGPSLFNSE